MSRAMKFHHRERLKHKRTLKKKPPPCGCWLCDGRPGLKRQELRSAAIMDELTALSEQLGLYDDAPHASSDIAG